MDKTCIRCKETFPLDSFFRDRTKKDGRTPYCRTCRKESARRHYKNYAPKQAAKAKKEYDEDPLRVNLGRMKMTKEQYYEYYNRQGGTCAICGEEETVLDSNGNVRRLSVDHDHTCCYKKRDTCGNCNRGLLCNKCNMMIGYAHDNVSTLKKAIDYINAHDRRKYFESYEDSFPISE